MKQKFLFHLLAALCFIGLSGAPALANGDSGTGNSRQTSLDPADLERQLQSLEWEQFRQVVYGIPKLKSGVDAYGPFGWEFVRANYRHYAWQKKLAKLNDEERGRLARLIQDARQGRQLGHGAADAG